MYNQSINIFPTCASTKNILLIQIPVKVKITGKDYKVEKIPDGVSGQVYVLLSLSATKFTDEEFIAGPAILEVYPKGKVPGEHYYGSYN